MSANETTARRRPACSLALLLVLGASSSASGEESRPGSAPPLAISIGAPHGGVVPGPVVTFEARISDPRVLQATLVSNGASYDVPVEQGLVRQQVVAVPGNNRVGLVVARGAEVARSSVTFRYDGEPMELIVLLTWPTEGEIIDLWVREPGGETCKWDHRRTENGGSLLDFSANAIGFGSQAYVLSRAVAGTFRIKIHYWGAFANDDERSIYRLENLIGRLDQLERELAAAMDAAARRRLEAERLDVTARLDRWASPAAPQTPVHAEVVLFPGQRGERRWRFDRVVQRTGQLLTLGEIEISDEMIRAARVEER